MPTIKKLSDVQKLITPDIKKKLLQNLGEAVVSELMDEYEEVVYSYDATSLSGRTYEFLDKNNYNIQIDGKSVEISSTIKPNESVIGTPLIDPDVTLAEWIEHGNIPNIFNDLDYEWTHPRPIVKTVKDKIQNDPEFKNVVARIMQENGSNVKIKK